MPLMSKMNSTRKEPPTSTVTLWPKYVARGMSELRRACFRTAWRKETPLATAVRTKSAARLSISWFFSSRVTKANEPMA